MKKRVLSGIRATGRLHLGNLKGAVEGMLALQDDPAYETLYMIADLHTMTTPYDPEKLRVNRREVVLDYLAAGLDPQQSIIFAQSDVPEHCELSFYFSTVVSVARMQHLPTFKDKVKQYPGAVTMALLNYPILMAADILAYKASLVPVGIDQEPHLEVAREVARKMNQIYGTDFPQPQRFETKGEYVPSLLGEGKMSKSVEGSYIQLTDTLEIIKERLAKTPTDEGKGEVKYKVKSSKLKVQSGEKLFFSGGKRSCGVETLLQLVELFEGREKREDYEKRYTGDGLRYQELKEELAERIFSDLSPIQKLRAEFEGKSGYVEAVLSQGAERARGLAGATLQEVRKVMGVR